MTSRIKTLRTGNDMDMGELEQGLKETTFEIKAEELFYQVRAHQLQQPSLEKIEDRIKKKIEIY